MKMELEIVNTSLKTHTFLGRGLMSGKNGVIRNLHEMCRTELRIWETVQNRKAMVEKLK